MKNPISPINIYDFGLKLLDFFETIHKAGFVLNELTLNEIRLGHNQKVSSSKLKHLFDSCFNAKTLHLTDFTYATPFYDFEAN